MSGAEVRETAQLPASAGSLSQRDWDDAHLTNAAIDVHTDGPAFGFRFNADELAENGFTASERCLGWR